MIHLETRDFGNTNADCPAAGPCPRHRHRARCDRPAPGGLTCNVETLGEAEARLGALLTPQGKILFDFLISRIADGFRLDVAADRAADLATA